MKVILPQKLHDWQRDLRTDELRSRGDSIEAKFAAFHQRIEGKPTVTDLLRAYRARRLSA